jgi:pimeloyl-ACP methyl ester carboxylesterase
MARWDKEDSSTIPDWFWQAVETEATTHTIEVDECDVVYRRYKSQGKPGMLLIHGMNAHSRWWDFIAPQLLDQFDIAAMDLCGMGDSDYRYKYDSATYAQEIVGVLDDAGFSNDAIVVAHSFGGYMAVKAANVYPDRFGALILVDSGIRHPDDPLPERAPMGGRAKAYPDKAGALQRFRLYPPQPCANEFITQYIARNSLMPVDGGGWAWKFDEDLLTTMTEIERQPEDYQGLKVPLGVIYGADSELFSKRTLDYMRELVPQDFPAYEVADAQHHVFLDQPLAFVETLRKACADVTASSGD